jgi:vancomycin resistance protein VanJ
MATSNLINEVHVVKPCKKRYHCLMLKRSWLGFQIIAYGVLVLLTIYLIFRLTTPFLPIWNVGWVILLDGILPWAGSLICVGLGLAYWRDWRPLQFGLKIALLCWALAFAPLFLPPVSPPAPLSGFKLRVLSYSVWYHNPQHNITAIAQLLASQQPDVILLQEIDADTWAALQPLLQQYWTPVFFSTVATEKRLLQAVLSRYPITLLGTESEHIRLMQTQLQTPFGAVHVWNIHAFRPNFLPGQNFLSYSSDFADRHQRAATQFDWLQTQAAIIHEPFIIGGDFNLPDLTFAHQQLSSTLLDAYWQAGWGFGLNYPASPLVGRQFSFWGWHWYATMPFPLVKLDHILYSDHFWATSATILPDSAGSDHAPLLVELQRLAEGGN